MSKNFSANYYQNNKERLQKIARKRYRGLFKNGREQYKNLPEDKKQKVVQYKKIL